jgi:hypothetical protein
MNLSTYIQQYFAAFITAVTNPNTGGFNDSTLPITPDEFEKRLNDEVYGSGFVHRVPTADEKAAISAAKVIYTYSYGDFVRLPLNGDAPVAVVEWQEQARKG